MVTKESIEEGNGQDNYKAFKTRIEKAEKDKTSVVCLFTGSKLPDGSSWCPDCNDLEKVLHDLKDRIDEFDLIFLEVNVGNRNEWKSKDSPFRTDPKLHLTSVPTLWAWGTSKKLQDGSVLEPENIIMLFED